MLIREERVSCSCGEVLVVEYQAREPAVAGSGSVIDYRCPMCARSGKVRLHTGAVQLVVRRATDTPVFPRLRLPE